MDRILDKTLITGAGGMVGSYVDFGIKTDFKELDITNPRQVAEVIDRHRPEVILHLAAETNMEKCETDPARAYALNSVGAYNIALAAKKIGARTVYISTDDVFSLGKGPYSEEDQPFPSKIYGHSKYLGELAVRGVSSDCLIVRTSWIFGGGKNNDKKFVAKIISQLKDDKMDVVNDQFGSPTFAGDLIKALKDMIAAGEKGLVHLTNDEVSSRYQVAVEIAGFFGSEVDILPVSADALNLPAYLRSSGGLASNRVKLRPWREALREYLKNEWND